VKYVVKLQELAGKLADGVPRAKVSTLVVDKAEGTLGRYVIRLYQLGEHKVGRKSTHVKEPYIDSCHREFGNPHASSSLSKSCSVASGISVVYSAPRVAVQAVVAVRGCGRASLGHTLWLGATRSGVEGHLVVGGKVDPFEDVDLATCEDESEHSLRTEAILTGWPLCSGTTTPVCTPHAAWGMRISLEDVQRGRTYIRTEHAKRQTPRAFRNHICHWMRSLQYFSSGCRAQRLYCRL
jgi:hypothetical protein